MDKRDKKIGSLNEDLADFYRTEAISLFNSDEIIEENIAIDNTGNIMNTAPYGVTGKIYPIKNTLYVTRYMNGTHGTGNLNLLPQYVMCCFNENDSVLPPAELESLGDYWKVFLPAGTKYIRCTLILSKKKNFTITEYSSVRLDANKIYVKELHAENLENAIDDLISVSNLCKGKKIGCLGDSITFGLGGTSWVTKLTEMCGFSEAINYGINGTYINSGTDGMTNRVDTMREDLDYITVMGGTNNVLFTTPTKEAFRSDFEILIEKLIAKYPSGKILGIIPPKFHTNSGKSWDIANSLGFYPNDYWDIERDVFEKYCIPFVDLFKDVGFSVDNETQKTLFMPDGLHPNADGNLKYLAPRICSKLQVI